MTSQMYIVLGALVFMIGMMVWNKYPMALVTLLTVLILGLAGILKPGEVLGYGFSQPTVLLMAGITGIIGSLNKTALIDKFSDIMLSMNPKTEFLMYLTYLAAGFVLSQFMASTQAWLILIAFVTTMPTRPGAKFTPYRMLIPMLCMMEVCKTKLPIGSGASQFISLNARYEGFFPAGTAKLLGFWDPLKFSLPLMVVAWIYPLVAWRLMPNDGQLTTSGDANARKRSTFSKKQNYIVYACFVVSIVALILNTKIGNIYYMIPLTGVFVIALTGVESPRQVLMNTAGNQVLACVGLLCVANCVSTCGLGDVLGNFLGDFYGADASPLWVYFSFAIFCCIITQFMSNAGTTSLMVPVAAMLCAAKGWDPRGLVLLISVAAQQSMLLPGGSTECALVYAAGGYNPLKTMRYTLPFLCIDTVAIAFTAYFMYPLV